MKKNNIKNISQFLNENIPFDRIRLIGENENVIINKKEALNKAQQFGLSLLCVSSNANPPVCKLIDYQKYVYNLNKQKRKKENIDKEIRISYAISEGDLQVKLNRICQLLEKFPTVKVSLVMKGKEKTHQDLAREKCQKIIKELEIQSPKISLRSDIHSHFGNFYFFLGKKK